MNLSILLTKTKQVDELRKKPWENTQACLPTKAEWVEIDAKKRKREQV